ncbi:AraC family transcriptional regulator [Paenibacillus thiaminolyticus]|uniref:helix-turn-helix domain-containing protein n=1 Tax=Paenibacillus thiaminolyticus TaxID=49283 RepID=UPI00235087AE|nr:AraC family transcriptional regulator [Paenibacillus thiaminolyticus]WCR28289.1 AraC family transcriptional regulator [Paenibacillus thiaminolyticus]
MRQYDTLCQYIWRERSDYHERLLRKMTAYIEANYRDPNFSLNAIADEFEMTSPYISAFFKKYGGRNITEYIAKLRVEEAKQLLADSRLTISDIAQRVGYASDVGFLRFFKKARGRNARQIPRDAGRTRRSEERLTDLNNGIPGMLPSANRY